MASPVLAWLGLASLVLARLGLAWLRLAWLGLAWLGLAWLDFSILVVKRNQANYRLEEEVLPKSTSVRLGRKDEEDDDGNHSIL
jgi:hypothetical protein